MSRSHRFLSLTIAVAVIVGNTVSLSAVEDGPSGIRLLHNLGPRRPAPGQSPGTPGNVPAATPPASSGPGEENYFAFGPAISAPGVPLNQTYASAVPQPQPRPKLYHSMWTVKILIRDGAGNYGQAVCYVSTHTFDGTKWNHNPAGLAQLQAEEQRLKNLGWFAYDRRWEQNSFQLRD